MNKGIFITGTDTGVGKTYVSEGLIKAMKEKGLNVCPVKPVETGCRMSKGKLLPQDTLRLLRVSGANESLDAVNPYRMSKPLAPSVAAELEGLTVQKEKLLSACRRLMKKYDVTIIEGAGGIMVPVSGTYLFRDLIKDLEVPLIVVSRPGLGTINHTLLTIEAAENKGLNILGVLINCAVKARMGLPEKTGPGVIEGLGGVPVLGMVPYSENESDIKNRKIFSRIAGNILSRLQIED